MRRQAVAAALPTVLAAALGGACGEPLERGDPAPLFTVRGTFVGPPRDPAPLVSVVWVDMFSSRPDLPLERSAALQRIEDDGAVSLAFHQPPSAEALSVFKSAGGMTKAVLAFGELVAVHDADGDGGFALHGLGREVAIAAPDAFVGAAAAHALVYVAEPPAAGDALELFSNPGALSPGYNLVRATCAGEASAFAVVAARDPVALQLGPAAPGFPAVRPCLDSHPR